MAVSEHNARCRNNIRCGWRRSTNHHFVTLSYWNANFSIFDKTGQFTGESTSPKRLDLQVACLPIALARLVRADEGQRQARERNGRTGGRAFCNSSPRRFMGDPMNRVHLDRTAHVVRSSHLLLKSKNVKSTATTALKTSNSLPQQI